MSRLIHDVQALLNLQIKLNDVVSVVRAKMHQSANEDLPELSCMEVLECECTITMDEMQFSDVNPNRWIYLYRSLIRFIMGEVDGVVKDYESSCQEKGNPLSRIITRADFQERVILRDMIAGMPGKAEHKARLLKVRTSSRRHAMGYTQ
jgi:hypothetical protein